jgi:benzoyl-CoA reductase/2-hydroxyglutaryl-CoA dehydratase subunit BcrC/BadD/HgdB
MANLNSVLAQFQDAAANPKKQFNKYLSEGKKVIGCAAYYIPEEIIHSMGCVPFGVWGADKPIKGAQRYFAPFYCSIAQTILDLGLEGTLNGLSAIVTSPLCDTLRGLGANWTYGVKTIPVIPMTYPQNRKIDAGKEFTRVGYERLIADLEQCTGAVFDDKALEKSIEVYNEHNSLMRAVSAALAEHASVSAAQRSAVFKSAFFMTKEEHNALLRQLLDALKETTESPSNKKRIITTGIIADAKGLVDIFDQLKFHIAGDDVASESRNYRTDAVEGKHGLEKMVNKFSSIDNCSLLFDPEKKRADYIVDMAKKRKAAGIVVLQTKFCDPEEFDYPVLKKAFDAAGIPSTIIEVDRQMQNYDQAKTNLQTFAEML